MGEGAEGAGGERAEPHPCAGRLERQVAPVIGPASGSDPSHFFKESPPFENVVNISSCLQRFRCISPILPFTPLLSSPSSLFVLFFAHLFHQYHNHLVFFFSFSSSGGTFKRSRWWKPQRKLKLKLQFRIMCTFYLHFIDYSLLHRYFPEDKYQYLPAEVSRFVLFYTTKYVF